MTTLILPPRYNQDSILLWKVACERGWDTIRMSAPEVERMSDESLAHWRAQESLVFYGYDFEARYIADTFWWDLLEPREDWLCDLPQELTGRHIAHMTLRQFRDQWSSPTPTFVKCAGDKHFLARVINSPNDLPSDLDPDLPVLVQEVLPYTGYEVRCFVLDGRILTGSLYKEPGGYFAEYGDPLPTLEDFPEHWHAAERAQKLINTVTGLPHPCVVDISLEAEIKKEVKGYLEHVPMDIIIEANAPFCSGLYECDPDKALDVISACAVRRQR